MPYLPDFSYTRLSPLISSSTTSVMQGWENAKSFFSSTKERAQEAVQAAAAPVFWTTVGTATGVMMCWNAIRPDVFALHTATLLLPTVYSTTTHLLPTAYSYIAKPAICASALFLCHAYANSLSYDEALRRLSRIYVAGPARLAITYQRWTATPNQPQRVTPPSLPYQIVQYVAESALFGVREYVPNTLRGARAMGLPTGAAILALCNIGETAFDAPMPIASAESIATVLAAMSALYTARWAVPETPASVEK